MRRVSASYNSPHIATTYVHELCCNSFGQNCSTSPTRYAHDIQGEVLACSCDPVRVNTTLVRVLRYVYENHTTFVRHFYEFSRVCKSSTRSFVSLYDVLRYLATSCGFENKNSDSWSLSHLFSREKQLI